MEAQTFLDGRVTLYPGNCLDVLAAMPANCIDSAVMDPPYHIASIVARFGKQGSAEVKAGATGAYKRASAGFIGKKWDSGDVAFQVETWRQVLRVLKPGGYLLAFASTRGFGRMCVAIEDAGFVTHPFIGWIFASGMPKATRIKACALEGPFAHVDVDGWRYGGQSLKPAIEPIFMGQKPFSEENGTANIHRYGTGAINIAGCRVDDGADGRWPANLIHDGSDAVISAFPGAPLPTAGSASRFFYSAKADADDRIGSKHPTVKPIDLMRYLVRLVTPPGGTVLDCFAGTGTTGEAAWREGFNAVLIEREPEYQHDIAERMRLCLEGTGSRSREIAKRRSEGQSLGLGPLFSGAAE